MAFLGMVLLHLFRVQGSGMIRLVASGWGCIEQLLTCQRLLNWTTDAMEVLRRKAHLTLLALLEVSKHNKFYE